MATSTATAPILLPIGTTDTAATVRLHLHDRFHRVGHALITGSVGSGKTVLLDHLAHTATTTGTPVARWSALDGQPLETVDVPEQGLLLLGAPFDQHTATTVPALLDQAETRGTAVVATAQSVPPLRRGPHRTTVNHLISTSQIWLHHRQADPFAPVEVTNLDRRGHGYLNAAGTLTEFRFGLHSTHVPS